MKTSTQQIPTGCKQTEVGVIPDNWEIRELRQLFEVASSKRVFQSEWKNEGVPFYRARELAVLGELGYVDNELFITEKMYEAYKKLTGVPKPGDMLVTGVGTLGKTYVVQKNHKFYFKDGNIIWFKINDVMNPYYLQQLYRTSVIEKQINETSGGSTVGTYTIQNAKKTSIPFPGKKEQTAIAEVLSDTDKLIEKMEKLIAKKKAIKQGAMQELLTGKKHLPGFSGKWELKRIGDVFRVTRGYVLSMTKTSPVKISDYKYPVYSSQTQNNGLAGYYTDYLFQDCITWTTDGANAGDVKYRKGKFYCTNVCGVLENKQEYSNKCVAAIFNSISKKYVSYVGNPKLMNNVVADIVLKLPNTIKEQEAISLVLEDMDYEIVELGKQLTKYRQIKMGMMQQLLTGIIRIYGKN
jgi:type I restriction enzyme S subunit